MLANDVDNCSFSSWYPDFEKVTFKSVVLPIPDDVATYLKPNDDNGLFLPVECDQDEAGTSASFENEETEESDVARPSFPEFCSAVREGINELGGSVLPKLNWSSPRDAAWMGFGRSLKCTTLTDVFTLLKSSEFVCHDLSAPYQHCTDVDSHEGQKVAYVLVLRRWSDTINRGHEFRCFVRDRELLGISQRDPTQFYDHIAADANSIVTDIRTFFREFVQNRFQSKSYVFDVLRLRKDRVKLVDFNPFSPVTDSHLFEWDELTHLQPVNQVDFRFVESEMGIQPDGLQRYGRPQDFNDLAEGNDPAKLIDFLKLQGQIQAGQDSSGDDEQEGT